MCGRWREGERGHDNDKVEKVGGKEELEVKWRERNGREAEGERVVEGS